MKRRIALDIATSEDGTKCAVGCPQFVAPFGGWRAQCRTPRGYEGMGAHGGEDVDVPRLKWCIAAEQAAREVARPSELTQALAFLASRLGVGYRVEEIFRLARERGWEAA
jgi:hypothetical protein